MLISRPQTIASDKLMLPKHQALAQAWDANKQQTWGELTGLAILMTSDMIKNNQFESIMELYKHMAGMRVLIGATLGHPPEVGKIGRGMARTPIENHPDSGYKDLHAEFKSWIELLRGNPTKDNVTVSDGRVTLTGHAHTSTKDDSLPYTRSSIEGDEKFYIFHSQDQNVLIKLANDAFLRLNEDPTISNREKQKLIEAIYFYLADAMPCARGAGSIAQMLFYALEDAHIGQMRYLGKMGSQFGHEQGVTPDIAAMLSPALEDFQSYLNEHVIDPGIKVIKQDFVATPEALSLDELLEHVNRTAKLLSEYAATLQYNAVGNVQRAAIEPMSRAFAFLKALIEKSSENPSQVAMLQLYLIKLKQQLANNQACYPQLYQLIEDKKHWPAPEPKAFESMPDGDRNEALDKVRSVVGRIHDYCSAVGYLYGWNSNTHHVATHYTAKKISSVAYAFKSENEFGTHDLNQCFSIFEQLIADQPPFGRGVNEVIDILLMIDEDKKQSIPQAQTEQKIYEKLCKPLDTPQDKLNPFYVRDTKNFITKLYEESEVAKQELKSLAPIVDSFRLDSPEAQACVKNTEARPARRLDKK